MKSMTMPQNFRFIINSSAGFIDSFFKKINDEILQYNDAHYCNFDHIMTIFIFVMEQEPLLAINYIMYYNLPFQLLKYLHFPKVFD